MARSAPRFQCTKPHCGRKFVTHAGAVRHVERAHPNFAGLIERRKARHNGATYAIYDTFEAGFESDRSDKSLSYTISCETHSRLVFVETLTLARHHLPDGSWCGVCQGTEEPDGDDDVSDAAL